MRSARTRIAATALTPLLVFGAAACEFGSDGGKKSDKKGGAGATAPVAPPAASAVPGTGTQASASAAPATGKALTAEQLKAALVTQKELGTGWTVKPGTSGTYAGSPMTAVEAACQPFLDLMTGAVPQPAAYAEETLTTKADQGTSTRLDLFRYADNSIAKTLDAGIAIAAKHDCIAVTATNAKGEKTAYRFDVGDHQPKLGDGALWIDVTWGDEKTMADPDAPTMTSRLQFVRVGSALVRFDSRPDNTSSGAEYIPDAQVKAQVDKLSAALAP